MKKYAPSPTILLVLFLFIGGTALLHFVGSVTWTEAMKTISISMIYAGASISVIVGIFILLNKYDDWRKS